MTTKSPSKYEETAILLRDFMLDYSWLFNFSNIGIIVDDFIEKVSLRIIIWYQSRL